MLLSRLKTSVSYSWVTKCKNLLQRKELRVSEDKFRLLLPLMTLEPEDSDQHLQSAEEGGKIYLFNQKIGRKPHVQRGKQTNFF